MTNLTKMQIDTGNSKPVFKKPYPIAMKHYDWDKNEINKLLDAEVICSSHFSWLAPIIMVPKGNNGKCLFIIYRALNKFTQKFVWPMLKVEDILTKLNVAQYFQPWIPGLDTITYSVTMTPFLKQLSHLPLENTNS